MIMHLHIQMVKTLLLLWEQMRLPGEENPHFLSESDLKKQKQKTFPSVFLL